MTAYRRTYRHALSSREAIDRIFEYKPQESSLAEILDLIVEQAERNYHDALADPDREAEIANLKNELALAEQERDLAREMYVELETAGDNLMADGTHEYLVLSKRDHHGLQPHFTKESLYYWAKDCHGKVVPEWMLSAQQIPALSMDGEYSPDTSARGRLETSFIIAGALAHMVEKLVEDEHIIHPTGDPCIKDDDTMDLMSVGAYIAAYTLPRSDSAAQHAGALDDRRIGAIDNVELLVLALVTLVFCHLAENARVNKWIMFSTNKIDEEHPPFYTRGKYNSTRVYNYLVRKNALKGVKAVKGAKGSKEVKDGMANQSKSSILHRLGDAKELVKKNGLPKFSAVQLQDLLALGYQSILQRESEEK